MDLFTAFLLWFILTGLVVGFWAVWHVLTAKPNKLSLSIPSYPESATLYLKEYFSVQNDKASNRLSREWTDTLRIVPETYKLQMQERCPNNETASARFKVILCVTYKMIADWRAQPTRYAIDTLLNLVSIFLALQSDAEKLPSRTDYLVYDAQDRIVTLVYPKLIREMKPRLQYLLSQHYTIPEVATTMDQPETQPLKLTANAFFLVLTQTYLTEFPLDQATCELCTT